MENWEYKSRDTIWSWSCISWAGWNAKKEHIFVCLQLQLLFLEACLGVFCKWGKTANRGGIVSADLESLVKVMNGTLCLHYVVARGYCSPGPRFTSERDGLILDHAFGTCKGDACCSYYLFFLEGFVGYIILLIKHPHKQSNNHQVQI